MQELERENAALHAQAAERASSSAAAAMLQNLAAATATAATATATTPAATDGEGMGAELGVEAEPPVGDDLGTAFVRRALEDACAKAVFAQRALDPEHGLLQMGGELGAGGHGTVHQAVDPTTGGCYAVKTANDAEGKACLKEEAKNLIRLGPHESVVEVKAIVDNRESMAIAMELGRTNLQRAMFGNEHAPADLLRYAAQVTDGVCFMHDKDLVHGDVKPDNVILVKKSETLTVAKLADLGLSRAVGAIKYKGCGTLGNSITPNNYFEEVPADKADDVWALGVLLLSLLLPRGLFSSNYLTSRVLHTAAEREALERSTTSKQRLKIKYRMSSRTANDTTENGFQQRMVRGMLLATLEQNMRDTACAFLRSMVDPDASKRPDIGEVQAWLPSIVRSAERQTAVMAAAALVPTTPSPPPARVPLSRGGSVSTISFSSSGVFFSSSSSSSSSAARTSDPASSPSVRSAPSAGGSVKSFSSSASRGSSGRLAVLLEDGDGVAVSGEQENAIPILPAATAATAAAVITPSMAASTSAQATGVDNSAPDSWMPSHDGSSLALAVGAAASVQDDVARNSCPEDAWSTGSSSVVSGIDAAVGINSSVDISQQQGELSTSAGSVRIFSGTEAAGSGDGLLPVLDGGEYSTGGSRQARCGEGEGTADAEGWSQPVAAGCLSVEGVVDGNGIADTGASSAVDVTLTLTPVVPAIGAEEGPAGDGAFAEHWAVGGGREFLDSGERGEAAAAVAAVTTGPRRRGRLGTFLGIISEAPAAAAAGAVSASPTMAAPSRMVPESVAFEGADTAGGQESWAHDLGTAAAGAGGWGIDLWVAGLAPLSQDVFAPEVNMGGQCGRYGRRRRRLPCFASFQ
ncbi:unnamed protein product [Ectocarpus fasciculatus]